MFCDVPRSNLHFLKNGGFQRNNTFKNLQKCKLHLGRYITFFRSLQISGGPTIFEGADCMGFSQNVSYIFEGFTYPKCKLHFGEVPPAKRVGMFQIENRAAAGRRSKLQIL